MDTNDADIAWPEAFSPSPASHELFAKMWALETWLRVVIYVELRTFAKDWERALQGAFGNRWPPHSLTADERLSHTTSPRTSPLDYLLFREMWTVLFHPDLEHLFRVYLPPRDVLQARVSEVAQVRHRLAHFREPHPTDSDRINLLLRDLTPGLSRFCTSYAESNAWGRGDGDPVLDGLMRDPAFSQFEFQGNRYSTLRPMHSSLVLGVMVDRRVRPWAQRRGRRRGDQEGAYYRVHYYAIDGLIDVASLIDSIRHLLPSLIHFMVESLPGGRVAATIPCRLGGRDVLETIHDLTQRVHSAVRGRSWHDVLSSRNPIADDVPFNVLNPRNPLVFLYSDMKCPIF